MAIRLSGLTSGLDTDAIVQELVSAYSLKTEKYEKQQTKLTWKQDAWKSLNTKIYSLYTNVSNMRMSGSYNLRKTTLSDNTKATVTASSDAVTGTQSLNIRQTAQASYITGNKLANDVTANTKMSELGYTGGNTSFTVEKGNGETTEIKITKTTTVKEVVDQLKEAGVNASFDATNKRIFISAKESGVENDFNLVADDKEGNDVLAALGLNTALLDKDGNFINGAAKYENAYALYQAAGADGVESFLRAELQAYEDLQDKVLQHKQEIRDYEDLKVHADARNSFNLIFNDIKAEGLTTTPTSAQLNSILTKFAGQDIDATELQTYCVDELGMTDLSAEDAEKIANIINSQEHEQSRATVEAYNKANDDLLSKSYAMLSQEVADGEAAYEAAKVNLAEAQQAVADKKAAMTAAGYGHLLDIKDETKLTAEIQNLVADAEEANRIKNDASYKEGGAVKITGQDAIIELNGVEYTSSTNGFSINGLSINAQAVTTDGPITITTNIDSQGIYDKIKDFLTEYNNVINEMAKLYNAESARDYEPLTDEEKEAMSEEQIEKWEDKIKGALLRRDGTLNSIMSTMVNSMAQSFEVGGQKVSLATFGISTLGFLNAAENENYAYHIDGDEDDENTSGKTDKLMKAIEENPDQLMEFMQKLTSNLYENIDEKMKSTELSSAYKVYNDKELDKEALRIEEMIKKWEEKVSDKEEYYYDKFSQMEVALSKLQSSTSSISSLLGQ